MLDAGVVHENVDLAEIAHAVVDHVLDVGHARLDAEHAGHDRARESLPRWTIGGDAAFVQRDDAIGEA